MLGCLSERNLAAVVDRPSDLVTPRREGRRDAIRRETVLSAWRADAKTPAEPALPTGASQP
jgi:type IV pilus biogenesis protein CpaD/CtpE